MKNIEQLEIYHRRQRIGESCPFIDAFFVSTRVNNLVNAFNMLYENTRVCNGAGNLDKESSMSVQLKVVNSNHAKIKET